MDLEEKARGDKLSLIEQMNWKVKLLHFGNENNTVQRNKVKV